MPAVIDSFRTTYDYHRVMIRKGFEKALLENQDVLYAAGLLKEGDTLYKILCRVAGKKYRKPKTRKSR